MLRNLIFSGPVRTIAAVLELHMVPTICAFNYQLGSYPRDPADYQFYHISPSDGFIYGEQIKLKKLLKLATVVT